MSDLDFGYFFFTLYYLYSSICCFSTGLKIKRLAKGNRFSNLSRWIPDLVPLLMEIAGLAAKVSQREKDVVV